MEKKKLLLPFAFLFGSNTLYAALCALYAFIGTDIVWQYTLWFDVIDVLVRTSEIIASAIMIAFLVYSVYRHGVAKSTKVMLLSLGALFYKYIAALIATLIAIGVLDLSGDILLLAFSIFAEIALAVFVVILTLKLSKAAADGSITSDDGKRHPLGALFSLKNRMNAALFFSVLTVAIGHAVTFLLYYIIGAPMFWSDVPVMLLYLFLFAILPAFLALLVARGLVRLCIKRNA